ncbi:hypothetical protein ARMGADRAFT_1079741 [Armillaria gallica]|uniref:Uncharacterized protein n=1 Tax=Armillaria gallica TaxID=47427 RepID=A0A2H3DRD2_ARMGA|nr:hypothetical protein ARMGADRAFT_1079741 [Armillaria gallica]
MLSGFLAHLNDPANGFQAQIYADDVPIGCVSSATEQSSLELGIGEWNQTTRHAGMEAIDTKPATQQHHDDWTMYHVRTGNCTSSMTLECTNAGVYTRGNCYILAEYAVSSSSSSKIEGEPRL